MNHEELRTGINRWLDHLPCRQLRIGHRLHSVYRLCGLVGVITGLCGLILAAAGSGRNPLTGLALTPVAVAAFAAWGMGRRWVTGRENTVLLEQLAVVLSAAALALYAGGLPVRPALDQLMVGLALFLACGRIGCLLSGCCYGPEAAVGIRYPKNCGPDVSTGRRLPLQALEALIWLGLAGCAMVLTWLARPGTALSTVLVVYSVVRFGLEAWRADPRPHWLGWSESRWLAIGTASAGLWLSPRATGWSAAELVLLAGAVGLTLGLLVARPWWLKEGGWPAKETLVQLEQIGNQLRALPPEGPVQLWTAAELTIGASRMAQPSGQALLLSVRRSALLLSAEEARLVLEVLLCAAGLPDVNLHLEPRADGLFGATVPWPTPAE